MVKPYFGKILLVDLSKGKIAVKDVEDSLYEKYFGGAGLGAYYLYKLTNGNTDPLAPGNPLIFMTGPLTGTTAPTAGRHAVIARSPLTNFLGESTSGGYWGAFLKKAGYDGVIVLGKSERPVYINIDGDAVEINDASELWGKNFYETREMLKEIHGKKVKVAAIGRAGEKLVKFSAIMNDHGRAAGRTGMGAVMGSKLLKAIVVYGEREIQVANDEFYEYNREKLKEIRESTGTEMFRNFGTAFYVDMAQGMGDLPAKYYREGEFPAEEISGITLVERYNVKPVACYSCPIACGRLVRLDNKTVDGPEYETLAMMGAQNMVFELDAILQANDLCNDYGLDTITTGAIISLAHFMYEKGYINEGDVGFVLEWGNGENVVKLVKMIAEREGFGNILAEGSIEVARKFGLDLDLVAQVKGVDVPAHDPRASFGQALSYATSNRGADHLRADYYLVDMGGFEDRDLGLIQGDRFELLDKVDQVIKMQNFREIYNSVGICIFSNLLSGEIVEYLNLAVGWHHSIDSLNMVGERLFNLKRVINNIYGVNRGHDKLPEIVLDPYKNGNIEGITPRDVIGQAIEKYYEIRGWDKESGKPKKEKLLRLGLEDIVSELEARGFW
ncbi:MAG: aldehyde ferredoxin oxidoreductase family protein [Candidatus Njordarchaeia archaeon]